MFRFVGIACALYSVTLHVFVLADPKLTWKKNYRSRPPLDICEGDCDKDSDCKEGLSCFQRNDDRKVPGCDGNGEPGRDYCYRTRLANPQLKWKKKYPSRPPLDICEGDCDKDSDCKEGLSCFQRNDDRKIPGCDGNGEPGRDYCYRKRSKEEIEHVGTTQAYVTGSDVYKAKIDVPKGTRAGDLLVLVLHRSDEYLPLTIDDDVSGWTRAAECFKSGNDNDCSTFLDCRRCVPEADSPSSENVFCEKFNRFGQLGKKTEGAGRDLAQAIFYKEAGNDELSGSKNLKLTLSPRPDLGDPAWMFLSAIRGADTKNPVRDWNGTGADDSIHSIFPSVYGKKGDLVLLSQDFDSGAPGVKEGDFLPPKGFQDFASMFDCNDVRNREPSSYKCDESGYLFGKVLDRTGETGSMITRGNGFWPLGDGLVSVVIIPKGGSLDGNGRGASEWLGSDGGDCRA